MQFDLLSVFLLGVLLGQWSVGIAIAKLFFKQERSLRLRNKIQR